MADKPVKLTAAQIDKWPISPLMQASGFSGGIFPYIAAGQQWPGLKDKGPRFLLDTNNLTILYLQDGFVFAQNTTGFVEDYRTYPAIRGAQGAAAMATVSVFVVDTLMGIASVAGGPVAVAVTGKDVIKFVHNHGGKVFAIGRVLVALARIRAVLMSYAPKLYSKVVEAVFKTALGTSWQLLYVAFPYLVKVGVIISPNLPQAVDQNYHKAGKATGKLIGKLGVSAIRGKLAIAGALVKVLLYIVLEVLKALPKAATIQAGKYKELALQLQQALTLSGVHLDPAEQQEIFEEIRNNPKKLHNSIKELNDSLLAL